MQELEQKEKEEIRKLQNDQGQGGSAEAENGKDDKPSDRDDGNGWLSVAVIGAAIVVAGVSFWLKRK